MTATKCTKKAWCTCKIVVLVNKPIAFLSFSLQSPSQSSALKSTKKKSFLAKVKLGKVPTTSLRFVCRAPKWEGQAKPSATPNTCSRNTCKRQSAKLWRLSGQLRESNHSGYNKIIYFLEEILLHAISSLRRVSYMLSLIVLRLLCNGNIENRPCAERSLTRGKKWKIM